MKVSEKDNEKQCVRCSHLVSKYRSLMLSGDQNSLLESVRMTLERSGNLSLPKVDLLCRPLVTVTILDTVAFSDAVLSRLGVRRKDNRTIDR